MRKKSIQRRIQSKELRIPGGRRQRKTQNAGTASLNRLPIERETVQTDERSEKGRRVRENKPVLQTTHRREVRDKGKERERESVHLKESSLVELEKRDKFYID